MIRLLQKPEEDITAPPALSNLAGKYLTFVLGEASYGIAVDRIREIIRMTEITAIPEMPHYIRGVINLRGKVIPVVDLRLRFRLGERQNAGRTCVIVTRVTLCSGDTMQVGKIVDAVEEVIHIDATSLEEPPHFDTRIQRGYLLAMAKIKGRVKILLNIDRVFSSASLTNLETIGV